DGGVELQVVHCLGSLGEPSAAYALDHLQRLLASGGEGRCAEVGLSGSKERARLLAWSDATCPEFEACGSQRVHEAFARCTTDWPHATATALVEDDRAATYSQLGSMAAQVAGRLVEAGVEPDSLVPLMSPRCIEMILGIYGILMAGAGYLPLDPGWPAERLAE
ncbi:unnamed protein product, partial [Prorocentrum cordatum]